MSPASSRIRSFAEQTVLIGYMRVSKADGSQTLYHHVDPNGLPRIGAVVAMQVED